jgi:rsbT co-antagonist protein RsbR
MATAAGTTIRNLLSTQEKELLSDWIQTQLGSSSMRGDLMKESELREQSREFLALLKVAAQNDSLDRIDGASWTGVREFLQTVSRSRAAMFIFSLKLPLIARVRAALSNDGRTLADETSLATDIIDRLGLYTMEMYQKGREEVISRQQQELMELSTPVVKLWENILALPLIGTLDSERTQVVMENLLQQIVETGAMIAIIDITGVPTVDTLVAQHLMKTIAAARLMGADCIISGIRPQIAQTIVHLGVNLQDVTTKATLADAFVVALRRTQAKLPQNIA